MSINSTAATTSIVLNLQLGIQTLKIYKTKKKLSHTLHIVISKFVDITTNNTI